jgi:hypothetical protein
MQYSRDLSCGTWQIMWVLIGTIEGRFFFFSREFFKHRTSKEGHWHFSTIFLHHKTDWLTQKALMAATVNSKIIKIAVKKIYFFFLVQTIWFLDQLFTFRHFKRNKTQSKEQSFLYRNWLQTSSLKNKASNAKAPTVCNSGSWPQSTHLVSGLFLPWSAHPLSL